MDVTYVDCKASVEKVKDLAPFTCRAGRILESIWLEVIKKTSQRHTF